MALLLLLYGRGLADLVVNNFVGEMSDRLSRVEGDDRRQPCDFWRARSRFTPNHSKLKSLGFLWPVTSTALPNHDRHDVVPVSFHTTT